jgi:hypothetical protein
MQGLVFEADDGHVACVDAVHATGESSPLRRTQLIPLRRSFPLVSQASKDTQKKPGRSLQSTRSAYRCT